MRCNIKLSVARCRPDLHLWDMRQWVNLNMEADSYNVFDKRVGQISEPATFYYSTTTIFNFHSTTLGTNYNYIRSS